MSGGDGPASLAAEIERLFALLAVRREQLTDGGPALTATQRNALAAVVDAGPLRLGTLADRTGASDATATRVVDWLERLRLVERAADPSAVRPRCGRRGTASGCCDCGAGSSSSFSAGHSPTCPTSSVTASSAYWRT